MARTPVKSNARSHGFTGSAVALVWASAFLALAFLGVRFMSPTTTAEAVSQGTLRGIQTAQGPLLVYTVLEGERSGIWVAPATNLRQARRLALVDHREGYGLKASLSPTGKRLAYLVLPPGAVDPFSQAVLWTFNLETNSAHRLMEGLDLLSAPVWSPDERHIVVRRSGTDEQHPGYTLLDVDPEQGTMQTLVNDDAALGLYPVGWADQPTAFYYARLTQQGTEVRSVSGQTPRDDHVSSVSDGIARDFRLSPQRDRLLYGEYASGSVATYQVHSLDLASGETASMAGNTGALVGPVWRPDGAHITLGAVPVPGRLQGEVSTMGLEGNRQVEGQVVAPAGSFLAPLAWSGAGAFLAARQFYGDSMTSVTGERLVVVSTATGVTLPIQAQGFAEFVGWQP